MTAISLTAAKHLAAERDKAQRLAEERLRESLELRTELQRIFSARDVDELYEAVEKAEKRVRV